MAGIGGAFEVWRLVAGTGGSFGLGWGEGKRAFDITLVNRLLKGGGFFLDCSHTFYMVSEYIYVSSMYSHIYHMMSLKVIEK